MHFFEILLVLFIVFRFIIKDKQTKTKKNISQIKTDHEQTDKQRNGLNFFEGNKKIKSNIVEE